MYNGWLVIWPYVGKITEIFYDLSTYYVYLVAMELRQTYDYKIPSIHEVFLFAFMTLENRLQV